MKISELIARLESIKAERGDLPVCVPDSDMGFEVKGTEFRCDGVYGEESHVLLS